MAQHKSAYRPIPKDRLITPEGYPFIIIGVILAVVVWFLGWHYLAVLFAGLTGFVCYFFRNPRRVADLGQGKVASPADGRIIAIEDIEHDTLVGSPATKISIFMSVLNCHVNRVPVAGRIEEVSYAPGKFFVASVDKASRDNERNTVVIRDEAGHRLAVRQIAGLIARRIVCYLKEGVKVMAGQRLGMIRFGSRVEIFVPSNGFKKNVKLGDKVVAGQSIIGWFVS